MTKKHEDSQNREKDCSVYFSEDVINHVHSCAGQGNILSFKWRNFPHCLIDNAILVKFWDLFRKMYILLPY